MRNIFRNILLSGLLVLTLFSCSEYQKALKSDKAAEKYKVADAMYTDGRYTKANRLFEQIVPVYRGKPQAEKLMFTYSKSLYNIEDYYLSSYHFDKFVSTYSKSTMLEEAMFLGAKSYYELSPIYSKFQTDTYTAIDKLQLFINQYPDSEHLVESNKMMRELEGKLEQKAFEIALQYNYTAYFSSEDYEAAIKSFENFIVDFPGTKYREDALFYKLDSAFKLAKDSIERKKKQRLEKAEEFYNNLISAYPDTKFKDEVELINLALKEEINNYKG
jgi:outer membrane protein assembly factor BamD